MHIEFKPITRENWEDALTLKVRSDQKKFAPSVAESLAVAYIKPWDEALDPYAIYIDEVLVGCFYISYTPKSKRNYWLGGFFIDHRHQGEGFGKASLKEILTFIPKNHRFCEAIHLTVEKENEVAQRLYKSLGFNDSGKLNRYGEIIYTIPIQR